jgi:hypothetical protein
MTTILTTHGHHEKFRRDNVVVIPEWIFLTLTFLLGELLVCGLQVFFAE